MSRAWFAGGALAVLCSLFGCGQSSQPLAPKTAEVTSDTVTDADQPAESPTATESGTAPETTAASEPASAIPAWRTEVQLIDGTWAETQALLEQQRGKVVVLDVWSTACEPCLRELPNLIALQERFPDTLVGVALNSDYAGVRKKPPEFYRERVLKVLESKQAKLLNVLCTEPADELFTELKIDSIPAVFVYDRDGSLAARFDHRSTNMGEFTYAEHVEPVVLKLLGVSTETASVPAVAP